jgi:hypothetical protein
MSILNESPSISIKSTDILDKRPTLIQRDSQSESPKSTISSISSSNNKNNNSYDSITKLSKEVDELLSSNNDKPQYNSNNQYSFEKECVRNISQLNSPLAINNNEIEMVNMKSNFEEPTHINLNRYHSQSTIHISDTENDMDDDHSQITDYTI